jgi:hypothetical protein
MGRGGDGRGYGQTSASALVPDPIPRATKGGWPMTDSTRRRDNPMDVRPGPAAPQGRRPAQPGSPPPAPIRSVQGSPPAPGAVRSPQVPGQVPDRSGIPGHDRLPVPKATQPRPPLTEFGTAQRIMRVFELAPDQADNPARWEQATASYEELRKADPSLLSPFRPAPGFNLAEGDVDLSVLPEAEGAAPALPPTPPSPAQAQPPTDAQKVSPSDAAVPHQARGATAPAPGDAVSPGGTLPAAKGGQADVQPAPGQGPPVAPQ